LTPTNFLEKKFPKNLKLKPGNDFNFKKKICKDLILEKITSSSLDIPATIKLSKDLFLLQKSHHVMINKSVRFSDAK